jgi:hypothetical protein
MVEVNTLHLPFIIMYRRIALVALINALTIPVYGYGYPSYNSGNYYASPNSAPVVVPPTVINPPDMNASKKSCRENVIDLFLFSIRNTSGDCTK